MQARWTLIGSAGARRDSWPRLKFDRILEGFD